jgi:hypothetical protein
MSRLERPSSGERPIQAGRHGPAHAAQIKRSAWMLAALAVAFYLGFIAWQVVRSAGG